jgi:hypothetical protein
MKVSKSAAAALVGVTLAATSLPGNTQNTQRNTGQKAAMCWARFAVKTGPLFALILLGGCSLANQWEPPKPRPCEVIFRNPSGQESCVSQQDVRIWKNRDWPRQQLPPRR